MYAGVLKLIFLNFEIFAYQCIWFFVCCHVIFLFLLVKMVDFGDCSHTILAFFVPENGMNDVSSSWKMDV
jgi:hypothetical protein